jgi:hypothetical protein
MACRKNCIPLLVASYIAVLFSCFVDNAQTAISAPIPKGHDTRRIAFPSAIGTEWTYKMSSNREFIKTITDVKEIDGGKFIYISEVQENGKKKISDIIEISEKGLFRKFELFFDFDPPLPLLLFSNKDSKWDYECICTDRPENFKIEGICTAIGPEKITVPAGSFETIRVESDYKIEFRDERSKSISWYASGVGLVKYSVNDHVMVLKKYTSK